MTTEALCATTTIPASADAVFTVLADPASQAAIDGTGWVRRPRDGERPVVAAAGLDRSSATGQLWPGAPLGDVEVLVVKDIAELVG